MLGLITVSGFMEIGVSARDQGATCAGACLAGAAPPLPLISVLRRNLSERRVLLLFPSSLQGLARFYKKTEKWGEYAETLRALADLYARR